MSDYFSIDNPMPFDEFCRMSNDYIVNLHRQEETEQKILELNEEKAKVKRSWGASVNKKKKSSSFWISVLAYALLSVILYFVLVPNVVELSGGVIFLWCAIFVVLLIIVYCINSGYEKKLMDKVENHPELMDKLTEEQKNDLIAVKAEIEKIDVEIHKKENELQSLKDEELNDHYYIKKAWKEAFEEYDRELSLEHPPKQYVVNGKTVSIDMKNALIKDFEMSHVIDVSIRSYLSSLRNQMGKWATPRDCMNAAFALYVLNNQRSEAEIEEFGKKEIERQTR